MSGGVLFRTLYGGNTGFGHIRRCLSLASALHEKGIESVFLLDSLSEDILLDVKKFKYHSLNEFNSGQYLNSEKVNEEDVISQCIDKYNIKIVFFDKYSIANSLIKNLKKKVSYIAGFDDFGLKNENYDLLIDHNFPHEKEGKNNKVLGGFEYCVLDSQFKKIKSSIKNKSTQGKINFRLNLFVNLGSGFVGTYEKMILKSFANLEINNKFNVYWLINNDLSLLNSKDESRFGIRKITYIDNMAQFLVSMDLAIGSCGVNAIERCCMGVPSLVFKTVENQQRNCHTLISNKLAMPVHNESDIIDKLNYFHTNPKRLKIESDRCSLSIDGEGAHRVANKIHSILSLFKAIR